MERIRELVGREPWLAVSLSWLLPGLAHVLSGARGFGVALIAACVFVKAAAVASAISVRIPILWTAVFYHCSVFFLAGYASLNAFRRGKNRRMANFRAGRRSRKDPYLAVFLTLLVPGLGHAYLRKWFLSVVVLLGYLTVYLLLQTVDCSLIVFLLLRLLIVGHICTVCLPPSGWQRKHFIAITVLLIGLCFFADCLQRFTITRYFLVAGPMVGQSMRPTFPDDGYALIDKFTYRYREPAVGEVIMFRPPPNSFGKEGRGAGKRIVAVAGETVQVREGLVYVNGQLREFGPDRTRRDRSGLNGLPSPSGTEESLVRYGVYTEYLVPEGHYFVLGDNRAQSVDSRCYGAIPRRCIIGRIAKVWPRRIFSAAGSKR